MYNEGDKLKSEIKKDRLGQAVRRKKQKAIVWIVVAVFMVIAGLAGAVYYTKETRENLPGQLIPDQGREHVGSGHQHTYNSNPPTSGWHNPRPAEWGAYKEELPDEVLLHNLEHGGVWISYKPGISPEMIAKLEGVYKKWGRKIIVAPRSANDTDIALVAWNRLDKFSISEYSEERVENFIKAYRNRGPEFVP